MLKIAHIINPVKVDGSSDLYFAQAVTFETMRIAREFSSERVEVAQLTAQYPEDRPIIPDCFLTTADLERSVMDISSFNPPRKLPLICDIMDRLYSSSSAEYFIYTNVDIALQPYFYRYVSYIIEQGYDAFIINRRTISDKFKSVNEIPLMYAEVGEAHKGYDCFVFKQEIYPQFKLETICIGTAWMGRALLANMVSYSSRFNEFRNEHLTFHLGNARPWKREEFSDYIDYNRKEYLEIVYQLESERGGFDPAMRSYLLDMGEKRQPFQSK